MAMRIILRDFTRTESDDFKLRVEPSLNRWNEALPLEVPDEESEKLRLMGWRIQPRYS